VHVQRDVAPAKKRPGAAGEFWWGIRLLGRGFATYGRSPGLLFLGMIPAFIALAVVIGGLVALWSFVDDLAALVTWFADDWSEGWRQLLRVLVGIVIVAASLLIAAISYTALTLLIGDPFYEKISEKIDERFGGTGFGEELPWYKTFRRNLVDSIRLIALGVVLSIPVFLIGFIPVVGQVVAMVLNAVIGGWLIAVELTGIPFNRRSIWLTERRKLLRANRALAMGFGVPVFLLLLIPPAAILVIPAAVVGSTLLCRRVLGQPIDA
jgi:CysZ protein